MDVYCTVNSEGYPINWMNISNSADITDRAVKVNTTTSYLRVNGSTEVMCYLGPDRKDVNDTIAVDVVGTWFSKCVGYT